MNINKRHIALGAALIIGNSASAQNLITNGDFETGLSGGGYGSYSNEIGTFEGLVENGITNDSNQSNWVITNTYQGAEFVSLLTPSSTGSWGARIGGYTSSDLTHNVTLNLTAGTYNFSADHWGEPDNSLDSQFTATLVYVGAGQVSDFVINTFVDQTAGSVQSHDFDFNLVDDGEYQLRLTGISDTDGTALPGNQRAWVDNISLTAVPEPSSTALLIGLGSMGFASYFRYRKAKR